MRVKQISYLIVGLLMVFVCQSCWNSKGKNIPDVSHIEVDFNVSRFEKDLFSIDTNQVASGMKQLGDKYPVFFKDVYLPKILPALQDPKIFEAFVKSEGIRHLYDTCMVVYNEMDDLEKELQQVFKYHKFYFPGKPVTKVVTYLSEYSLGVFTYEGILGIGLDFFLGADYPYYNPTFFPQYIKRSMNREHLTAKAVEALATDLVGTEKGDRLLDIMINNGKILYVMDHLLPHAADSIKLGYTAAQTNWVNDNELQIWSYLIGEDLLYSSRSKEIRKLHGHSPNTPGMPDEAPGRTANWIGWQIVKAYMTRHPEQSMEQLIAIESAQQILDQSKYKPAR